MEARGHDGLEAAGVHPELGQGLVQVRKKRRHDLDLQSVFQLGGDLLDLEGVAFREDDELLVAFGDSRFQGGLEFPVDLRGGLTVAQPPADEVREIGGRRPFGSGRSFREAGLAVLEGHQRAFRPLHGDEAFLFQFLVGLAGGFEINGQLLGQGVDRRELLVVLQAPGRDVVFDLVLELKVEGDLAFFVQVPSDHCVRFLCRLCDKLILFIYKYKSRFIHPPENHPKIDEKKT